MRNLKKFVKPIGPHQFHEFSLDVSSLIVATSAFEKKGKVKDETSKKIVKPMEVKLRSKMSH